MTNLLSFYIVPFSGKQPCFLTLLLLSTFSFIAMCIFGYVLYHEENYKFKLFGQNTSKHLANNISRKTTVNFSECLGDEDFKTFKAIRSSKSIWTISPNGRFGNLMGQYATLFALARLNRKQAYILPGMAESLSQSFKLTLPTLNKEVKDKVPWQNYNLADWMEEKYKNISGDHIHFFGFPCSWTFYHHIREEILREFSFHAFITTEVNSCLRNITAQRQNITYVGVHVRRGDYVYVMPEVWKGVIADRNYLERAMFYFRSKYKDVVFIVTSNGIDWCRKNIDASKGDVYFLGDGNESKPQRDFAILAHCNHTIMTIGTFGFWVAYLAGGEVIYLTNFTLPGSPFLREFKYEAAFLPEWIGIAANLSSLLNQSP
ncbi:galactoside alpha-(1,2)-fucosyltransferase 2-like [Scyliorhinus canicula]|uniref:galactoside alpha-(1,2)-fucosyltransferase 2-like n=1 Tax=Scyliorhinus canicula TaxID=7830 RepID=UPI0018F48B52|nr:galactoside alpha-(1,2)-fucosyltransferase 2-like [Scyliorhinus canicula]